jgi:serine/threonine-protein kinase
MPAQKERVQRTTATAKEARSRGPSRGRPARHRRARRNRRRRVIVFGVVAVLLVLALVGGVTAALLGSGGPATGTKNQHLSSQTLLSLPAASAVASGLGGGYVSDDQRDVVERFDPATGRLEAESTRLSGQPVALVLAGADLWIAEAVTNSVVEVTAQSLKIVRSVLLPAAPSDLTVLGNTVWVSSVIGKNLTPIDDQTGLAAKPVGVIAGAVRVASGFGALWVTGTTDYLTRLLPSGPGKMAQSPLKVGQGPIGVATGAGAVWVANAKDGTVSRIDPSTLTVNTLHGVAADPLGVAVAGARVFVSSGTGDMVQVVSPAPSHSLEIGTSPRNLLAVGTEVWVAGSDPGRVLSVSTG